MNKLYFFSFFFFFSIFFFPFSICNSTVKRLHELTYMCVVLIYRPILNGFYNESITLRLDIDNRATINDVHINPKGPSAGQSTMFLLIDLVLGIKHAAHWSSAHHSSITTANHKEDKVPWILNSDKSSSSLSNQHNNNQDNNSEKDSSEKVSSISKFQSEMLKWYTPTPHRMFIEDFVTALNKSGYISIKKYLEIQRKKSKKNDQVEKAYQNALSQLASIRQAHMKIAVLFLNPSTTDTQDVSNSSNNTNIGLKGRLKEEEGNSQVGTQVGTDVGTGSSSFKSLLAEALNNTRVLSTRPINKAKCD